MAWVMQKGVPKLPLPDSYPPLLFSDGKWDTLVNNGSSIQKANDYIYIATTGVGLNASKEGVVAYGDTWLSKAVNTITITASFHCWGDFDGSGRGASNYVYIDTSDDGVTWTVYDSFGKSISWAPSSYQYNVTLTQAFSRPTKKYFRIRVRSECHYGSYGRNSSRSC